MINITENQLKLTAESILVQNEIEELLVKSNTDSIIINKVKKLSNRLWRLGMYYDSKNKLNFDKKNRFIDPYKM